MGERQSGKVIHWDDHKQFGFIRPDGESDNDIFVHIANVVGAPPDVGQRVQFLVELDPRRQGRRRAKEVTPL